MALAWHQEAHTASMLLLGLLFLGFVGLIAHFVHTFVKQITDCGLLWACFRVSRPSAAFYDRNLLVINQEICLGPAGVSPGLKQIPAAAGFLLCFAHQRVNRMRSIAASPSQRTFPVSCAEDSSRKAAEVCFVALNLMD